MEIGVDNRLDGMVLGLEEMRDYIFLGNAARTYMNDIGAEVDLLTIIISARAAGLVVSFLAGPILVARHV